MQPEIVPPLPPDELIERVFGRFTNDERELHQREVPDSGRQSVEDLERALASIGRQLGSYDEMQGMRDPAGRSRPSCRSRT